MFQKGSFLVAARRSFADIITSGAYTSLYNFLTNSSGASSPQPVFGGGGRFGGVSTQQTPVATFYDIDAKLTYNFTPADIVSASFYAGRDDLNKSAGKHECRAEYRIPVYDTCHNRRDTTG